MEHILAKLNLKSLEELISTDQLHIPTIAKSTIYHPVIVEGLLLQLQQIISGTKKDKLPLADLREFFKGWDRGSMETPTFQVHEGQIVEIIGRCGKSTLLNHLIGQLAKNGHQVMYLDGHSNSCKLITQIGDPPNVKHFHFKGLFSLAMTIHAIGNHILAGNSKQSHVLCIDSLSQVDFSQSEAALYNEAKTIEKFKNLLVEFARKAGAVMYTRHTPSSFTLFDTQYKEKHRPKATLSNWKLWDSISSSTICVDYATTEQAQILKMVFPKAVEAQVSTLTRKR